MTVPYCDSDGHRLFNLVPSRQRRSSFEIAFFRADRFAELEFHKAFVQPREGTMWVIYINVVALHSLSGLCHLRCLADNKGLNTV